MDNGALGKCGGSSTSTQVYYLHDDALGGTSVVSNASGTVSEVLEYYPFGRTCLDDRSASFSEQRRFTGHEFDTGTGLNYMDARYQAPTLGRFLSEDRRHQARIRVLYGRQLKRARHPTLSAARDHAVSDGVLTRSPSPRID